MSTLPSTTYQSPPRLGRGRQLNTILEEKEDASHGMRSDSEGDGSDSTVIGRPAAWDPKLFIAPARKTLLAKTDYPSSPVSSCGLSPPSSAGEGYQRNSIRSSIAGSESGTVFSDDCPSLASDPTSFATESSRNSFASEKSTSRNRYPALIIPRTSWGSMADSPIKEIAFGMSPATKIRLSPTALSALTRDVPEITAPPSLGDSNSSIADSPCDTKSSAPVTPDMRQMEVTGGQSWGQPPTSAELQSQPLEIALDEDHSVILSPAEAHSDNSIASIASPVAFAEMIINFPSVPGATPQELSPLMPTIDELKKFPVKPPSNGSDLGVRLPADALHLLQRLAGQRSVDSLSNSSGSSRPSKKRGRQEMRERPAPESNSRPRSADGVTPVSDYSFSQLSIPSPGGFFSSLQNGSRHTWCLTKPAAPSIPNTATAENFYNRPWENGSKENVVETVLTFDDTNLTEGPPTARQATFNLGPPAGRRSPQSEDDDLYGPSSDPGKSVGPAVASFEYDEKYYEELKHSSGQNLDRTGSWLAAQTDFLSAILDSDPNSESTDETSSDESSGKPARRTVTFAVQPKVDTAMTTREAHEGSPDTSPESKEPIFLSAFQHLHNVRKRRDAFINASSRLEAVQNTRIALQDKHIANLLGQHTLLDPKRPKYSGPFSQNPRQTGVFERTPEQLAYMAVEREQLALNSVEPSNWQVDALRAMYHGRLLASSAACERLKTKSTVPLDDPTCVGSKRLRVLDIGGTSSASWAWHAALEWPNVKVYTVITKDQARAQRPQGMTKPDGPANHRTISVPHLWQLPFRNGHFDVISARSLHVLLKNNPVPGVPSIDEWDLTLRECMRVLKPGGYIDYMIMDSSIAHAGPRAEATSVEFGFELHRRGYEREAARSWLKRLKKENFVGVKRAWVFLPMGRKPPAEQEEHVHGYTGGWQSWRQGAKPFVPAPRPISEVSTISKIVKQYMDVEAVQGPVGSTADVADLTGLLGARMWEEWIVKVRAESGRERSRWLEGVDEMIEEGKEHGSGWKVLIGWARKPRTATPDTKRKAKTAEITIAIEEDMDVDLVLDSPVDMEIGMDALSPISPLDEGAESGMITMVIQG
jgi:SAM-dependent methyltransferase